MKGFTKLLAATFLSAAMIFTSLAQAMQIQQFDKMAVQDQGDFIQALVDGAQKVLNDEGRSDLAAKVNQLFTEIPSGDKISLGMTEFERNLNRARLADAEDAEKNPKAQRIEVEDAMAVTLQANHIDLPDSFFTVASHFKPKLPPQTKEQKRKTTKRIDSRGLPQKCRRFYEGIYQTSSGYLPSGGHAFYKRSAGDGSRMAGPSSNRSPTGTDALHDLGHAPYSRWVALMMIRPAQQAELTTMGINTFNRDGVHGYVPAPQFPPFSRGFWFGNG